MLRVFHRVLQRAPLLSLILFIWLLLTILSLVGRKGAYKDYSTEHGRLPGLSLVMRGVHDHVYPWSGDFANARAGQEKESGQAAQKPAAEDAETEANKKPDAEQSQAGEEPAPAEKTAELETAGKTETKPLTIPETSCSKVAGAKDYGVAKEEYLSPEDTVYNTDTEGLFAPNGTYYSLQEVDDSYFADALMIGDSRTVGLYEYGDMANVTSFLAKESASIYDLLHDGEKLDYTPRGEKSREQTLKKLLSKAKFKKIYISVGINELGVPDTKDYYEEYRKVVAEIYKLQPDAIIYIQGIMHVSKNMSSTDPVYNNKAIVQRNKAISTLANGRNIFYIDMNGIFCDKNGDLKTEMTGDGIHLKASSCALWHDFLRKNAIVIPAPEGTSQPETGGSAPAEEKPAEDKPAEKAASGQA